MDETVKKVKKVRQHFFVARELQMSMALLVVLALIGGIVVHSLAVELGQNLHMNPGVMGVILVAGYVIIVIVLSVYFSHRLIGPFRRLEGDIERIKSGEFNQRLYVRKDDDQHIRKFVEHINGLIAEIAALGKVHGSLISDIERELGSIADEMSKRDFDIRDVKARVEKLRDEMRRLGGK